MRAYGYSDKNDFVYKFFVYDNKLFAENIFWVRRCNYLILVSLQPVLLRNSYFIY